MKRIIFFTLAVICALGGVIGGVWFGIWFMLIGGIIEVIEGIKANPVNSFDIAYGIVRFLFAGLGWVIVLIGMGLAGYFGSLAESSAFHRFKRR
jgi:hypothetical protein